MSELRLGRAQMTTDDGAPIKMGELALSVNEIIDIATNQDLALPKIYKPNKLRQGIFISYVSFSRWRDDNGQIIQPNL